MNDEKENLEIKAGNSGRFLGIDYGTKRVGTALTDQERQMAFPDEVLTNDSHLIEKIQNKIKKENITKVIIGESKNYKMEDNAIMSDIIDLKDVIEKTMEIDVVLEPEFMSSMQAEKIQGKNDMIDASAAAIVLQSYLDKRKK